MRMSCHVAICRRTNAKCEWHCDGTQLMAHLCFELLWNQSNIIVWRTWRPIKMWTQPNDFTIDLAARIISIIHHAARNVRNASKSINNYHAELEEYIFLWQSHAIHKNYCNPLGVVIQSGFPRAAVAVVVVVAMYGFWIYDAATKFWRNFFVRFHLDPIPIRCCHHLNSILASAIIYLHEKNKVVSCVRAVCCLIRTRIRLGFRCLLFRQRKKTHGAHSIIARPTRSFRVVQSIFLARNFIYSIPSRPTFSPFRTQIGLRLTHGFGRPFIDIVADIFFLFILCFTMATTTKTNFRCFEYFIWPFVRRMRKKIIYFNAINSETVVVGINSPSQVINRLDWTSVPVLWCRTRTVRLVICKIIKNEKKCKQNKRVQWRRRRHKSQEWECK